MRRQRRAARGAVPGVTRDKGLNDHTLADVEAEGASGPSLGRAEDAGAIAGGKQAGRGEPLKHRGAGGHRVGLQSARQACDPLGRPVGWGLRQANIDRVSGQHGEQIRRRNTARHDDLLSRDQVQLNR